MVYKSTGGTAKPEMHTLKVPRGGEYKIILPDNTVVTMNSESELICPNRFSGDRRGVASKQQITVKKLSR